MPEFHKNQVRWEAPEAQKVTLAKPDYTPLANAFMNLSDAADKISKTTAAYLDNQLDKTLNELSANTDDIIKNADSLDANYDFIADEAMAKWDQTLNSFDEATRNRYLRDNPEARDIFELGVRAKTLKKSRAVAWKSAKSTRLRTSSCSTCGKIRFWRTSSSSAPPRRCRIFARWRTASAARWSTKASSRAD